MAAPALAASMAAAAISAGVTGTWGLRERLSAAPVTAQVMMGFKFIMFRVPENGSDYGLSLCTGVVRRKHQVPRADCSAKVAGCTMSGSWSACGQAPAAYPGAGRYEFSVLSQCRAGLSTGGFGQWHVHSRCRRASLPGHERWPGGQCIGPRAPGTLWLRCMNSWIGSITRTPPSSPISPRNVWPLCWPRSSVTPAPRFIFPVVVQKPTRRPSRPPGSTTARAVNPIRQAIISREHSYHGNTLGSLSVSGNPAAAPHRPRPCWTGRVSRRVTPCGISALMRPLQATLSASAPSWRRPSSASARIGWRPSSASRWSVHRWVRYRLRPGTWRGSRPSAAATGCC